MLAFSTTELPPFAISPLRSPGASNSACWQAGGAECSGAQVGRGQIEAEGGGGIGSTGTADTRSAIVGQLGIVPAKSLVQVQVDSFGQ